jgi:hypothetical protein
VQNTTPIIVDLVDKHDVFKTVHKTKKIGNATTLYTNEKAPNTRIRDLPIWTCMNSGNADEPRETETGTKERVL